MALTSLRRRFYAGLAVAGIAAAIAPAAASASLTEVALATDASNGTLVLDVAGGSTQAGAGVIQWYGYGGANQIWNVRDLRDGNHSIVNYKTGMCLTTDGVPGHQLYQAGCSDPRHQEWHGDFSDGWHDGYLIVNPGTGLAMDIEGGSRWAGARLIAWYPTNAHNQHFSWYELL
jgi:hypothetical protein